MKGKVKSTMDKMQGSRMRVDGLDATVNAFDLSEMLFIYMSLKSTAEYAKDVNLNPYAYDREEVETTKFLAEQATKIMQKLETTFDNMGIDHYKKFDISF